MQVIMGYIQNKKSLGSFSEDIVSGAYPFKTHHHDASV